MEAMKIAFVGLGQMGVPMALNLLRAGHTVRVWNRSPERAAPLLSNGAVLAQSAADAAKGCDVAISMLADDVAVMSVTVEPDGLCDGLAKGALHVAMGTISVDAADKLARAHAERGQGYVSAPVFGRPDAAVGAQLSILAAGAEEEVARCAPLFEALGKRTFVVGSRPSQANIVKLSGNFMIMAATQAMSEAMAIALQHGVDRETVLEIMTGTLFDAPIYRNYGAMIVKDTFRPAGFTAKLGLKDMTLLGNAFDADDVSAPFLSVVQDRLRALIEQQGPDIDWAAIGKARTPDSTD